MYQIHDVDGLVDNFTTISGLKYFRERVAKDNPNIEKFLESGSSLITEVLLSEIYSLKSDDVELRKIIKKLQSTVESADTILILSIE